MVIKKKAVRQLNGDSSIGEWVSEHPLTRHVFMQFEIDFCLEGFLSLEEACRRKRIGPDVVLAKLAEAIEDSNANLLQKPVIESP